MPYDPSTLIPAYKKKVEELLAKDEQFRNIVEKQVSNFPSMATSSTNGITLKEGIAGIVAGKPRSYGLNKSPYFKKNREKYLVLKTMHKEITKLPINILTNSSKKSAKSSSKNKPTSPIISYTNPMRQKELELQMSKLAKMPNGLSRDEKNKYMFNAYKEAHEEIYGPSKKSAKSSSKNKPTTLNMKFLPGPSGLPGAMQRIPSSTGLKPNPYRAALRKKRKATKKNKPSKRSKASNKSKSSKKTRRRTRRRRY
tara:strand:+ start:248 stop:1009 length:762 start_codon:yes stop_codon:yes gene_type:complete